MRYSPVTFKIYFQRSHFYIGSGSEKLCSEFFFNFGQLDLSVPIIGLPNFFLFCLCRNFFVYSMIASL